MGFSKQCTKCGKIKWWYKFYLHKTKPLNLKSQCKVCERDYGKNRYNEVVKNYKRIRYKNNSKRLKNYFKKYKQKHKDILRYKNKIYSRKVRKEITDQYCKKLLINKTGLKSSEITKEMIDLQRGITKLNRATKEMKNDIRSRSSRDPQAPQAV